MKNFFSKENLKSLRVKKAATALCVIALVCCVGVVNAKLSENNALGVSAGYRDYEENEMNEHSGDVLVDSLNLKSEEGTSQDAAGNGSTDGDADSSSDADGSDSSASENVAVTSDGEVAQGSDEFFRESRETLAYDRNEMIATLTDTIESAEDGSEKNSATQQKEKIMKYMEQEKSLENLIRNKGYSDAFVIITDKSVTVTVQAGKLEDADVAKILDVTMRETEREADDIIIQAKSA